MKSFPLPAVTAALAAVVTLPFNVAASGMLFLTAGLGVIIHADYVQRAQRVRLPRRRPLVAHAHFRRFSTATEPNRLAA